MIDLKPSWDPYIEHTDVDHGDYRGSTDHDPFGPSAIREDDSNTVDDDLK